MKTKARKIAIAGATGMVGQAFLRLLEENFFQDAEIILLASKKSKGKKVKFRKKEYIIEDLSEYDFTGTDLALFSAGASVSAEFAPKAVSQGCVVVDNSSCFRYEERYSSDSSGSKRKGSFGLSTTWNYCQSQLLNNPDVGCIETNS